MTVVSTLQEESGTEQFQLGVLRVGGSTLGLLSCVVFSPGQQTFLPIFSLHPGA